MAVEYRENGGTSTSSKGAVIWLPPPRRAARTSLDAEHWIAAWEREAASGGLDRHGGAFWEDGEAWIADGRRRR